MSKTKSTIQESGKLQRRHSSYAKVRTQKVGSPASQPASQAVAELESEAIPRQSVRRPPMASISNSAKEEGRQQCCGSSGGGGWWRRRLLAAASEKGPYFFSLAASACLVGRSPFTVLRKVSTFLMPFLEIPGLFRHVCTILFA